MAKSQSTELLSKLKSSLPKISPLLQNPTTSPTSPSVVPTNPGILGRAPKLSVSLYHKDLDRLDQIKRFMHENGHRNLSDSEALRLACRAVEIGDRLLGLYTEMHSEDGRRKTNQSS